MSCDVNLEAKERLYDQYLDEGHSHEEAVELTEQAFQEMAQ